MITCFIAAYDYANLVICCLDAEASPSSKNTQPFLSPLSKGPRTKLLKESSHAYPEGKLPQHEHYYSANKHSVSGAVC